MSKDPLGGIVLRLLDDCVSPSELRKVLRHLRDRPTLRERCSTIGNLVDADDGQKALCCTSMITVLLNWIEPNDPRSGNSVADNKRFIRMGSKALWLPHLLSLPKTNFWHNHTKRAGIKPYVDKNDNCYITVELYEIVEAIENLWGQQRWYTVPSRNKTTVEFVEDQLQQRGALGIPEVKIG